MLPRLPFSSGYWLCIAFLLAPWRAQSQGIDLLRRYPTSLTRGDLSPNRARPAEFDAGDLFQLSRFKLSVGQDLTINSGAADLAIGHCADGAVWAIVMPKANADLITQRPGAPEAVSHVWLRFHPGRIDALFPPETVSSADARALSRAKAIANYKLSSSFYAGSRVMIPETNQMTVDLDTTNGMRRFFVVDTRKPSASYIAVFESRAMKPLAALAPEIAEKTFDELWSAFDSQYAMFVIRPNVDWTALREKYRKTAVEAKTTREFAEVCADMMGNLKDLHVRLTLSDSEVPVFNRPRAANANPSARAALIGNLKQAGPALTWAVTGDRIGYINIANWTDRSLPAQFGKVLEEMRNTRGLILDVRLNGGGDEPAAAKVAGRFATAKYVYAYSQYRNGPEHANLTSKLPRLLEPGGPWRYNRPVLVLIGEKCMSSNESFISMMGADPDAATMGARTCGSSGNPKPLQLPLNMTVTIPQWIDYLPGGGPLEDQGIKPQIPFDSSSAAFEGNRDDLLSAALERLRQAPLPPKPIDGDGAKPSQ